MKVLITGANGFIGSNLVSALQNIRDGKDKSVVLPNGVEICTFDTDSEDALLDSFCADCDFVFHLAGLNRAKNPETFLENDLGITKKLLQALQSHGNRCPVLFTSSTQATLPNPYGASKKAVETLLFQYSKKTGAKVLVYRLPNVFGKWSRPNYNSAVATFCYNISRGLPITVNDRSYQMTMVYIDDVVAELLAALGGKETRNGDFCKIPVEHQATLGEIADLLYSFRASRENRYVPDMTEGSLSKKLYSTYLSYLPADKFSYPLEMHKDNRGSFTEILRTVGSGQFSVNISKPGITKGDHWHNTKNEKFLVVSGKGVVRFRKPGSTEVLEYFVSGEKLEVVDIPVGYTHNIENLGDSDMVTFMWCNECFDPNKADTYALSVAESDAVVRRAERKSVLVLGGAGMAGFVIATYFRERGYEVTIFDRTAVEGFSCVVGSAFDTDLLKRVLTAKPYCAVLNCIALLNRACDENKSGAVFLNGYLPHFIADTVKDSSTKLIHISSDCVFSGGKAPYTEADLPDATDAYGSTKAIGEVNNQKDLTFRTSIVGADRDPRKQSLVNWFMQQSSAKGFTNVIWSGVSTVTLARAMEAAIQQNLCGIYHLVNNAEISKYDLLHLFNQYLRNPQIELTADDSVCSSKTLRNTRTDFDFCVPSYAEMIGEIAEWIKAHPSDYPHYAHTESAI